MDPIGIGLGVIAGGSQIFNSIGQYQQQQNVYRDKLRARRLKNRQTVANYGLRIGEYIRDIEQSTGAFLAQAQDLEMNVRFRRDAVQRGIEAEQRRLNEIYASAAFSNQDRLVNLLENLGVAQASGMRGRTAERFDRMQLAQAGRNMAMQAEQLTRADNAFANTVDDMAETAMAQNRMEASRLYTPMFGDAPVIPNLQTHVPTAPSPASMYMGIAKGVVKGLAVGAAATGGETASTLGIKNTDWGKVAQALD